MGQTKSVKHEIHLEDPTPIKCKPYKVERESINQEIEEVLKYIIHSP